MQQVLKCATCSNTVRYEAVASLPSPTCPVCASRLSPQRAAPPQIVPEAGKITALDIARFADMLKTRLGENAAASQHFKVKGDQLSRSQNRVGWLRARQSFRNSARSRWSRLGQMLDGSVSRAGGGAIAVALLLAVTAVITFQFQLNLLWVIGFEAFIGFAIASALIWAMRMPADAEIEAEMQQLEKSLPAAGSEHDEAQRRLDIASQNLSVAKSDLQAAQRVFDSLLQPSYRPQLGRTNSRRLRRIPRERVSAIRLHRGTHG